METGGNYKKPVKKTLITQKKISVEMNKLKLQ